MFSASQVILAIVFVCAGVVLTRAMGRFPTSEGGAMEMVWKKINLWLLIGSYMITAVMGFSFDVAYYTRECHDASWGVYRAGGCTADVQGGCLFHHRRSRCAPSLSPADLSTGGVLAGKLLRFGRPMLMLPCALFCRPSSTHACVHLLKYSNRTSAPPPLPAPALAPLPRCQ